MDLIWIFAFSHGLKDGDLIPLSGFAESCFPEGKIRINSKTGLQPESGLKRCFFGFIYMYYALLCFSYRKVVFTTFQGDSLNTKPEQRPYV